MMQGKVAEDGMEEVGERALRAAGLEDDLSRALDESRFEARRVGGGSLSTLFGLYLGEESWKMRFCVFNWCCGRGFNAF